MAESSDPYHTIYGIVGVIILLIIYKGLWRGFIAAINGCSDFSDDREVVFAAMGNSYLGYDLKYASKRMQAELRIMHEFVSWDIFDIKNLSYGKYYGWK